MKLYDLLNGKDKLKILGMWLITVLCSWILFIRNAAGLDYLLITVFISALFFAAFLLMMTNDYVLEERELHVHRTIQRSFLAYGGCMAVCTLATILPVPVHVMMAVSALFCMLLPVRYGLFLSLLISIVISLNSLGSYFDLIYFIFLCMVGGMFSGVIIRKKIRLQSTIMMLAMYISIYFIGTYMSVRALSYKTLVSGCVEGILNILLIVSLTPLFYLKEEDKDVTEYGLALEDEFPLMAFVKSLPEERYRHSRFTANCCYRCAKAAGLNENLSCLAGFYYSLCDNDEKEPVTYAVKLAKQNGLPIQAVRILSQYQGRECDLSTKEAALVDLVDETLGKLEKVMDSGAVVNPIEREMLVLKTFNDLSATGRYDESGLSMNSFLKIRESLLHEVEIYDSKFNQ